MNIWVFCFLKSHLLVKRGTAPPVIVHNYIYMCVCVFAGASDLTVCAQNSSDVLLRPQRQVHWTSEVWNDATEEFHQRP